MLQDCKPYKDGMIMATNELEYAYTAFKVVGDSMDDSTRSSFEEGDKLLVIPVEDFRTAISVDLDSFWVIEVKNGILFKQIIDYSASTDTVTCHSLNTSYLDYQVQVNDIDKVYKVVQKQGRPIYYGD